MKKSKKVQLDIFRDITLSHCYHMTIKIPANLTKSDEDLLVEKFVRENQWDALTIDIGEPNTDDWEEGVQMIEVHKDGQLLFRDSNPD